MADNPHRIVDLTAALRDQLALLSILVIFAGLRFVEAYYWRFHIPLSTIQLPIQYFVYKGVLSLFVSPFIALAYLGCVSWLALSGRLKVQNSRMASHAEMLSYLVVAAAGAVTYFAAADVGDREARKDALSDTSRLPAVLNMTDEHGTALPYAGYRILLNSSEQLILFQSVSIPGEIPYITILRKGSINAIKIRH